MNFGNLSRKDLVSNILPLHLCGIFLLFVPAVMFSVTSSFPQGQSPHRSQILMSSCLNKDLSTCIPGTIWMFLNIFAILSFVFKDLPLPNPQPPNHRYYQDDLEDHMWVSITHLRALTQSWDSRDSVLSPVVVVPRFKLNHQSPCLLLTKKNNCIF